MNTPAFPSARALATASGVMTEGHAGMSLRDYFAAKAMQAIVSHDPTFSKEYVAMSARDAYAYADAMLKAREA
jgi:hypothetical protein